MVAESPAHDEANQQFQILQDWLIEGGAHINSVQIKKTGPGERCLQASDTISPNTPFLRIPSSHLISDQKAKNSPHVAAIISQVRASGLPDRLPDVANENAALLLYMIAELAKGDDSFWAPWINTLPKYFHTPINNTSDLVEDLLQGTSVSPLVETLREELSEMYNDWFIPFAVNGDPQNYPSEKCSFELFLRAHSIIESRSFKIDDVTMLVPFADMANHAPRNTIAHNARARGWMFEGSSDELGLEMHTGENQVSTDDQLCISYGRLPNWQTLVHYGFTLMNNPDDEIILSLEMPDDDQTEHLQKMIVLHVILGDAILDHAISVANPLPLDLLAATRILLANGDELHDAVHRDFRKLVSVRNEELVIKQLRTLINALLDSIDICDDTFDQSSTQIEQEENSRRTFSRFCGVYVNSQIDILKGSLSALDRLEADISQ